MPESLLAPELSIAATVETMTPSKLVTDAFPAYQRPYANGETRVWHDISHATRVMIAATVWFNWLISRGTDIENIIAADLGLEPGTITTRLGLSAIQLASVWHDAGRQDEGADRPEWERESGNHALNSGLSINPSLINVWIKVAEAIANKDYRGPCGTNDYSVCVFDADPVSWSFNPATGKFEPWTIEENSARTINSVIKAINIADCIEVARVRGGMKRWEDTTENIDLQFSLRYLNHILGFDEDSKIHKAFLFQLAGALYNLRELQGYNLFGNCDPTYQSRYRTPTVLSDTLAGCGHLITTFYNNGLPFTSRTPDLPLPLYEAIYTNNMPYLLLRGITHPNLKSIGGGSSVHHEYQALGNPDYVSSASLVFGYGHPGSRLHNHVGLALIGVRIIAGCPIDAHTGHRDRRKTFLEAPERLPDHNKIAIAQGSIIYGEEAVPYVLAKAREGVSFSFHNEVLYTADPRHKQDAIVGIYFTPDGVFQDSMWHRKFGYRLTPHDPWVLQAIYIQQAMYAISGKDLPIFLISFLSLSPMKITFTKEVILKTWQQCLVNTYTPLMNYMSNFWFPKNFNDLKKIITGNYITENYFPLDHYYTEEFKAEVNAMLSVEFSKFYYQWLNNIIYIYLQTSFTNWQDIWETLESLSGEDRVIASLLIIILFSEQYDANSLICFWQQLLSSDFNKIKNIFDYLNRKDVFYNFCLFKAHTLPLFITLLNFISPLEGHADNLEIHFYLRFNLVINTDDPQLEKNNFLILFQQLNDYNCCPRYKSIMAAYFLLKTNATFDEKDFEWLPSRNSLLESLNLCRDIVAIRAFLNAAKNPDSNLARYLNWRPAHIPTVIYGFFGQPPSILRRTDTDEDYLAHWEAACLSRLPYHTLPDTIIHSPIPRYTASVDIAEHHEHLFDRPTASAPR